MPQEPKKRHSRQRKGKRRASIHLTPPQYSHCENCGLHILPHMVCKSCGYYKGKVVIAKKKEKKQEETQASA